MNDLIWTFHSTLIRIKNILHYPSKMKNEHYIDRATWFYNYWIIQQNQTKCKVGRAQFSCSFRPYFARILSPPSAFLPLEPWWTSLLSSLLFMFIFWCWLCVVLFLTVVSLGVLGARSLLLWRTPHFFTWCIHVDLTDMAVAGWYHWGFLPIFLEVQLA